MSKSDGVFIYIGTYASEVDARADYDVVKDLHAVGGGGTYDAAVITKDDKGKIHVNKDETTTRHGAWGGALRAPWSASCSPIHHRSAIVGAAIGGVSGHLWKGCPAPTSRNSGSHRRRRGGLVIVGETTIEDAIEKAHSRRRRRSPRSCRWTRRTSTRRCRRPRSRSPDPPRTSAGAHLMIVTHSFALGRRPGGLRRLGLGAEDRGPAPGRQSPPVAVRLRPGLPALGAPAAQRRPATSRYAGCTRPSPSSPCRWPG